MLHKQNHHEKSTRQLESNPRSLQLEKNTHSNNDPAQPNKYISKLKNFVKILPLTQEKFLESDRSSWTT